MIDVNKMCEGLGHASSEFETIHSDDLLELIDRLEQAEQAVARVREFLEYRKAYSAVARDGLRALDGDTCG